MCCELPNIQGILGRITFELREAELPMSSELPNKRGVLGGITYELRAAPHKGKELEVVQTPDTVATSGFHSIDGLQLPDKLQVPKNIRSPSLLEHL